MSHFELRNYQKIAIETLRSKFASGCSKIILVAPTGSGKTVTASEIIKLSIINKKRILFLAHRRELISQASTKLHAFGIPHGIIMAGVAPIDAPVQVGSIQTLVRREIGQYDLIICDECHHAPADSYLQVFKRAGAKHVIGLTATPFRIDGRGLGNIFDDMVRISTVDELIVGGFLVPARTFAPSYVDMTFAKKRMGDFTESEASYAVDRREIIGDVVEHYLRLGYPRKTVCFAVNIVHSKNLCQKFRESGLDARHLDANTPLEERIRILNEAQIICNCGILSEGWDKPEFSCCIQARPTASLSLHIQQIGRVLRPFPGKKDAIVLDHAGNTLRLGLYNENYEVSLEKGLVHKRKEGNTPTVYQCLTCYACFAKGPANCPVCGTVVPIKARVIQTKKGILGEIGACKFCLSDQLEKRPHERYGTGIWCRSCGNHLLWIGKNILPREYFQKQLQLCKDKGWKPGRASIMFQKRYGRWPTKEEMNG